MVAAPFNDPASLAPPRTERIVLPDGAFVLRHPEALQPYARCVGDWLEHWAFTTPDAPLLAERAADGGWRRLSYGQVREQVGRIAQALLDMALPAGQPVVVLSDNSIDHALLGLAAMHVGAPLCTVSSAYCRLSKDHGKIKGILDTLQPALVYACDPGVYGAAIRAWGGKAPVVYSERAAEQAGAMAFEQLLAAHETPAVTRAFAALAPTTTAKLLLTSGSTGTPKVVINTHRMLCANQQQMAQVWPFLTRHPLHLLDWLPWSHTFGANHNFNMVLAHGGSFTIDDGRPAPGLIDKTVRNLREVRPNFYFNVPRGFDMLLPHLERDEGFARDFFERLEGVFYAGAALPQSVWERLEAVARRVRERPLWFTSSWGATETAPAVTSVFWRIERAGCIGAPLPGVELKFVPAADAAQDAKLEMRVRGPNVFPGYRDAPELTAQAFDADGYYRIGDAGRLVDPARPECGVAFDGRVAEDFKLTSGTWVSVGTLRLRAISRLTPWAADVVITGHDREQIGLLVFASPQAMALSPEQRARHLRDALVAWAAEGLGSSQTPTRALWLDEPPNADAGEITDKGYVNQRRVLERRAADVLALDAPDDPRVVRV
jgi:feruloyl-CoA synthase